VVVKKQTKTRRLPCAVTGASLRVLYAGLAVARRVARLALAAVTAGLALFAADFPAATRLCHASSSFQDRI
jgi:hypothetical protein